MPFKIKAKYVCNFCNFWYNENMNETEGGGRKNAL